MEEVENILWNDYWVDLCSRFGHPFPLEEFEKLCKSYSGRAYHNLQHVLSVLRSIDAGTILHKEYRPVLYLAAFYHDVNEDEVDSCETLFSAGWDNRIAVLLATQCIFATIPGRTATSKMQKIMQDADLAILYAPKDEYTQYAHNIRKEYSRFSYYEYVPGRQEILRGLLTREKIYHFGSDFEELWARNNIRAELEHLEAVWEAYSRTTMTKGLI